MDSISFMNLQKRLLSLAQLNKQRTTQQKQQSEDKQQNEQNNSLTIAFTKIQKFPIVIKIILEQNFQNILQLTIVSCDLRTFDNFPKLKTLRNVNVSKNSLRGSFEYLVKNRTIKYIDVSSNIIGDIKRFQPLKYLKDVCLYAKNNPFDSKANEGPTNKNNVIQQLKAYGIKYLNQPMKTQNEVKKEDNVEKPEVVVQQSLSKKSLLRQKLQRLQKQKQRQKQRQRQRERLSRPRISQGNIQFLNDPEMLRLMRFPTSSRRASQVQSINSSNNNNSRYQNMPRLAITSNPSSLRLQRNDGSISRLDLLRVDSSENQQQLRLQGDNSYLLKSEQQDDDDDDDDQIDLNQNQFQLIDALEAQQQEDEDDQPRLQVRVRQFGQMRRIFNRIQTNLHQMENEFRIESDSDSELSESENNNQ